ncbi:glycosyltransferase [Nitrincola schmidtii]|uniref:glycosyltransferase n=1 Tax=Nitrincola schmidtii TaxID=1730894 RepID=UPI00124D70AE|nr:glycosyltransferase [Nitrincola schmidtii]
MNDTILRVFIGYDPVENVAWHTMVQSIIDNSSIPIAIIPVNTRNLKGIYNRERDGKQSNEFSFTRFLVPYLSGYQGYSVFFDCDMMLRADVSELLEVINRQPGKAVYVVKHDYVPKNEIKYLGTVQYSYPRKNWSSVVLWNCSHPKNKIVDPNFVNSQTGLVLHRFKWLDDNDIGDLDIRWNWLVGEYENPPEDVKNVHWTIGGPYFNEYSNVPYSDEWRVVKEKVVYCKQLK